MSNSYLKAAFVIVMSRGDAAIVRDAELACDIIATADETVDLTPAYDALGFGFRTAFPGTEDKPFAGFFALFEDPVYPTLDCEIAYGLPDAMGMSELSFTGEQFGVEQVANLLFACKSALPCAFEYAYDCDRLRIGEFGGGAVVITEQGVTIHATGDLVRQALAAVDPVVTTGEVDNGDEAPSDDDEDGDAFVLARRDPTHGLSFWNETTGYGRLATARVFTEAEAGAIDLPEHYDGAEWLSIAARRSG